MKRPRAPELGPGDLVAVRLRPEAYAIVWVTSAGTDGYTVFVMDGCWPGPPSADDARTARPARCPHPIDLPGYDDVWKGWFHGRVPRDFEVVGNRTPDETLAAVAANATGTMVFGTGERLRDGLLFTWRLTNDRAALDAEIAARQARAAAKQTARRAALTLPKLLRERLFADWSEHVSPGVLRAVRRIFRDATKDLIALERKGTPRERAAVLKRITTEPSPSTTARASSRRWSASSSSSGSKSSRAW